MDEVEHNPSSSADSSPERESGEAARHSNARTHLGPAIAFAAFIIALADQLLKTVMVNWLEPRHSVPVIPGVFHLTYVENPGAAFGLFKGAGLWLTVIGLILLGTLALWGGRLPLKSLGMKIALGCGLGGAVSNILDRVLRGHVIDFIDLRVWPIFNLADVAITFGLGTVCLRLLFTPEEKDANVNAS